MLKNRFVVILGVLASMSQANAAMVGHYTVDIQGEAESSFRLGDVLAALNGWRCHAVSSVTFSEERLDHHGAKKLVPQKSNADFTFSLLSSPRVSGTFQRDMSISRNDVVARIGERCSRNVVKLTTCTRYVDGKRETYPCTKTEHETASLFWNCEFPSLPGAVGQSTVQNCSKIPIALGSSLSGYAMMGTKLKDFQATMRLERVEESFRSRLCSDESAAAARYLIQLQGGVGGHVGEDDFHFKVFVNGQEVPEFRVNSGLLNEEILYCSDREEPSLRIKIGAVEKDLIFDDVYSSAEKPVDSGSLSGPENAQVLELRRSTYLGEWFTDKNHEIRVRVKKLD
jgi:hypothetical protein